MQSSVWMQLIPYMYQHGHVPNPPVPRANFGVFRWLLGDDVRVCGDVRGVVPPTPHAAGADDDSMIIYSRSGGGATAATVASVAASSSSGAGDGLRLNSSWSRHWTL